VDHCEADRYRIALLDPPRFSSGKESVELGEIQAWRRRFDSKYAALYFPWLLVYDPLQPFARLVRPVPPSGHVAGIYARTDFETGVHKAPANQEARWAQDVTTAVDDGAQGILNPLGVNCFRVFPGRGLLLYGARTISSEPAWVQVSVRRLFMMMEQAIEDAVQWAVFEPNDFNLREALALSIGNFLDALWSKGALKGSRAEDAYFVKFDETAAEGQLIAIVGAAPSIPAEFVVFRVGRTADTLEVAE
jgi:phage tail sheath protein FI